MRVVVNTYIEAKSIDESIDEFWKKVEMLILILKQNPIDVK